MSNWRERFVSPSNTTDSDGRPDLAAVLEHYAVRVIPYRRSQMVQCPLHQDNHPSCSVNTDKQVWRCHSCGEGGDSYHLLMKMEGIDFDGARALAATLGLAEGESERGSDGLRGSAYGNRRKAPSSKGSNKRDGGYVPSWKRS